jgi:hypothetical protein
MSISVQLELSDESKRWMRKFPVSFKKGFYKGIQEAMLIAEREAKKNAPVLTGTLRRSIRSEVDDTGLETVGSLFSNLIYSAVIELGWRARNIKAQPYLEPALKDNLERFTDRIEKAIEKEVMSGYGY